MLCDFIQAPKESPMPKHPMLYIAIAYRDEDLITQEELERLVNVLDN